MNELFCVMWMNAMDYDEWDMWFLALTSLLMEPLTFGDEEDTFYWRWKEDLKENEPVRE